MIQAMIFDRDNTLLAFDEQAVARLEARVQAHVPELPATATQDLWESWPGPWPQQSADEPGFWLAFCDALVERHGIHADKVPALCDIFDTYHTCFSPFADSNPCLQALHAAGLRLGVLTNFELPSIDRTLIYAGIDPQLFEVKISSATLGVWKPDPRTYQAIAEALGLPPTACAFIDDDPQNVAGARAQGMRAFLLDRGRTQHDFDADILCSLDPLPQLLAAPASVGVL